jgi:hypothetical protein
MEACPCFAYGSPQLTGTRNFASRAAFLCLGQLVMCIMANDAHEYGIDSSIGYVMFWAS